MQFEELEESEHVEMVYIIVNGQTMLVPESYARASRPLNMPLPSLRPAGTMTKRVIQVEPDLPPVVLQTMMGMETEVHEEDVFTPQAFKRIKKELEEARAEGEPRAQWPEGCLPHPR